MQAHVDKEINRRINRHVKNKLYNIEQQATRTIASSMLDVKINAKYKDAIDLEKAKEILKYRRNFKNKVKEIYGDKDDKDLTAYRVGMSYAGNLGSNYDDIIEEVRRDIEVEKNIEFYDKINEKYEQVHKYIDKSAASALNGIMADTYGTGAYFNADMVKELGINAVSRAIAYKIQRDGKSDIIKEALIIHSNNVRLKTVNQALNNANKSIENTKDILKLANGENSVYSKTVANGYAIRHRTKALQELSGAAGSLRAMAHLIEALDDPPNDLLQIDMGSDLILARRRMKRAGLKSEYYSLKKQNNGRYMAVIKSTSLLPFFEDSHETNMLKNELNAIKRHELNTGRTK